MMQGNKKLNSGSGWLIIFCLVFAGEIIFSLPFHVARFFRPTLLDVFDLSNAAFGDVLGVYGITAMVAYFPGGIIADRFSARKLITLSLATTALGGVYFALIPGQPGLYFLFGYWGVATIFLFWAALIKATRDWGGELAQGRAFGILDGGRGLIAAGAATLAVFILQFFLPGVVESSTDKERVTALKAVIWFYVFLTSGGAVLAWFFIPDSKQNSIKVQTGLLSGLRNVLRNRLVWLQAVIVISAYCGYKGLDYYSLYGVDILGMNEESSARFVSNASWLRVIAAIIAGLLVDRFSGTKVLITIFLLLMLNYSILAVFSPASLSVHLIIGNILLSFAAVYALRGVYFALLEETGIEKAITGTAVGFISVIGYTPDVFLNSVAGRILDASPGLRGYQDFFKLLTGIAIVGLIAALVLAHENRKQKKKSDDFGEN